MRFSVPSAARQHSSGGAAARTLPRQIGRIDRLGRVGGRQGVKASEAGPQLHRTPQSEKNPARPLHSRLAKQ